MLCYAFAVANIFQDEHYRQDYLCNDEELYKKRLSRSAAASSATDSEGKKRTRGKGKDKEKVKSRSDSQSASDAESEERTEQGNSSSSSKPQMSQRGRTSIHHRHFANHIDKIHHWANTSSLNDSKCWERGEFSLCINTDIQVTQSR